MYMFNCRDKAKEGNYTWRQLLFLEKRKGDLNLQHPAYCADSVPAEPPRQPSLYRTRPCWSVIHGESTDTPLNTTKVLRNTQCICWLYNTATSCWEVCSTEWCKNTHRSTTGFSAQDNTGTTTRIHVVVYLALSLRMSLHVLLGLPFPSLIPPIHQIMQCMWSDVLRGIIRVHTCMSTQIEAKTYNVHVLLIRSRVMGTREVWAW